MQLQPAVFSFNVESMFDRSDASTNSDITLDRVLMLSYTEYPLLNQMIASVPAKPPPPPPPPPPPQISIIYQPIYIPPLVPPPIEVYTPVPKPIPVPVYIPNPTPVIIVQEVEKITRVPVITYNPPAPAPVPVKTSPPPPPPPVVVPQPPPVPAPVPVVGSPPVRTPAVGTVSTGCVVLESYIPCIEENDHFGKMVTNAWMIEKGMKINLANEKLETFIGEVKGAVIELQPCVRVLTKNGVSLVCSTSAPLFTKEKGYVDAPEILGLNVAVNVDGKSFFDTVITVEDVGKRFVRAIDANNNGFWAGEKQGSYILHHNIYLGDDTDAVWGTRYMPDRAGSTSRGIIQKR